MDFRKAAEANKILEVRVGSHLFGTDTPDSDLDLHGIFMPFPEIVYGSYRCENVRDDVKAKDDTGRNTKDAVDRTLVEYRKFVQLALQNNPNILHLLFADDKNVMFEDEAGFGRRLLSVAERFPYKGCHHRFVKYADSQRHKMRIKPENYAALEFGLSILGRHEDKEVLADVVNSFHKRYQSFEGVQPFPFSDEGKGKHVKCGDLSLERGVFVKKARRIIEERLSKAIGRVVPYTKYGYDVKFASNLIQLLREGIEILNTGRVQFPLEYRQDILDIKAGKYTVEQILKWADELVEESRSAYNQTKLPANPRTEEIEAFAMSEVKKYLGI